MAGIGFELRKLFMEEKEQPFGNIKALIFKCRTMAYYFNLVKSSYFNIRKCKGFKS